MKVLLVDDEQLDLFIAKKLLSMEFNAEGFTTLEASVSWARDNAFDVALIDYYVGPGIFAQHVLKALLALNKPPFKAFVLSNHVSDQQARELYAAGFAGIIEKPITLEKFKQVVAS